MRDHNFAVLEEHSLSTFCKKSIGNSVLLLFLFACSSVHEKNDSVCSVTQLFGGKGLFGKSRLLSDEYMAVNLQNECKWHKDPYSSFLLMVLLQAGH